MKAIFFQTTESSIHKSEIFECKFIYNFAFEMGGAIYIREHLVKIDSCAFVSNTAYQGGALFLELGQSEIHLLLLL